MTLGRTGSDTLTHIVSIMCLLVLGLGSPAILCYFQHAPLDDVEIIALAGFWSTISVMMAYYSVQYQTTATGTTIVTKSPDGTTTTQNP